MSNQPRKGMTCCADGCVAPVQSRGYCIKHYNRVRRLGTTELPTPRLCSVAGCGQLHRACGYCAMHYATLKRRRSVAGWPYAH